MKIIDPFSNKSVRIFAKREYKKGTPIERIPMKCAQKFKAFGLDAWIWEDYIHIPAHTRSRSEGLKSLFSA